LELALSLPIIVRQLCFVEMVKYTRTHLSSCSSRMIKILKAQGLIGCGQLKIFILKIFQLKKSSGRLSSSVLIGSNGGNSFGLSPALPQVRRQSSKGSLLKNLFSIHKLVNFENHMKISSCRMTGWGCIKLF